MASGKPLRKTAITISSRPLFFRLFMIDSQNLAPSVGNPKPQNLTFTLRGDAQSHINGLVRNLAAFRIADFDPQGI